MIFYGFVDRRLAGTDLGEVFEFFPSRELAEEAMRAVITDGPDFQAVSTSSRWTCRELRPRVPLARDLASAPRPSAIATTRPPRLLKIALPTRFRSRPKLPSCIDSGW
jgi:hypothetical protein